MSGLINFKLGVKRIVRWCAFYEFHMMRAIFTALWQQHLSLHHNKWNTPVIIRAAGPKAQCSWTFTAVHFSVWEEMLVVLWANLPVFIKYWLFYVFYSITVQLCGFDIKKKKSQGWIKTINTYGASKHIKLLVVPLTSNISLHSLLATLTLLAFK